MEAAGLMAGRRRIGWRGRRAGAALAGLTAWLAATAAVAVFHWIGTSRLVVVSWGGSVAAGVFVRSEGGGFALFCPPPEIVSLALARGYTREGEECPGAAGEGGSIAWLKPVVAESGATVVVEPDGTAVDGRRLERGATWAADSRGRPMPRAEGRHVLGAGEVWVQSEDSSRSLDSRVFGPIDEGAVLWRYRRLGG